jgi:kynurenine formamidase
MSAIVDTRAFADVVATLGSGRVVDLSATIANSPPEVPAWQRTDIEVSDHAAGAADMHERFGVPPRLLRRSEGPATEQFTRFGTHNSTHIDAPFHYNSIIGGQPATTIDKLPLEWFLAPGVKLDMGGRADGDAVSVTDIQRALDTAEVTLRGGEIVLIRTGCDQFYGQPDYAAHGPGVSPEATLWLYDHGIRVMGIDAWGWDSPVALQARDAVERDATGIFWGAHQIDREYAQIERMVNLGELPAYGFVVVCLPLKIAGGSAGPTRAIAIVPHTQT